MVEIGCKSNKKKDSHPTFYKKYSLLPDTAEPFRHGLQHLR